MAFFKKRDVEKRFGENLPPNQVVFRRGDAGEEMFIIREGEVKIVLETPETDQVLATLGQGEFFGEMAIFNQSARSATAITTQYTRLLRIPKSAITDFMLRNKEFAFSLAAKLSHRLSLANNHVETLIGLSRELQVLKALVSYWQNSGSRDQQSDKLKLSYPDFIAYLAGKGIAEKDANMALNKLRKQNILSAKKESDNQIFIYFLPVVFEYFSTVQTKTENPLKFKQKRKIFKRKTKAPKTAQQDAQEKLATQQQALDQLKED